ncbi:MAG: hypothetical protein H6627_10080 [Calditrichae bacterium]|nr:hypothetical protein [Calditrichota bacterium]MCB9058903.1 hypothetical protein [Calditrichia bacterium]
MKLRLLMLMLLFSVFANAQQNSVNLYYNPLRFSEISKADVLNDTPDFDITTDESGRKSVGKALLYSLILPGAGEFYVGDASYGKFFLGMEIIVWGSYLFNQHQYSSLKGDYKAYASLHADVSKAGKDAQYWINIGKFDDIYNYNEQRRRDRRVDDIYEEVSGSKYWNWDSRDNRFTYDAKRLKAVSIKNREVYFVTGILVNHLVSAINAVRLARKHNRNLASNPVDYRLVIDTMQPQNAYFGIALSTKF